MSENAKWYVVHTYSGYENKVMTNLEKTVENRKLHDLIVDIRVPTETVMEIKGEETKEVKRKLFPGYVLVKMVMTDDSWYVVRNIRGVTGFVGPSGSSSKPVPLSPMEVARLEVDTHAIEVSYDVGDVVKIIEGPLQGSLGQVEAIEPENNIVRVVVSMFGRETPVELELNQVKVE